MEKHTENYTKTVVSRLWKNKNYHNVDPVHNKSQAFLTMKLKFLNSNPASGSRRRHLSPARAAG